MFRASRRFGPRRSEPRLEVRLDDRARESVSDQLRPRRSQTEDSALMLSDPPLAMQRTGDGYILSATDLSVFLGCHHRTAPDMEAAVTWRREGRDGRQVSGAGAAGRHL
jgi:hypothetical protein